MTPIAFVRKWQANARTERAAAQEHFIDLCGLLDMPTPNTDPTGEIYAFEKGAKKSDGTDGWADVWKRDRFAWEYKKKRRNLRDAYDQLLKYRESLENPPILVVSDMDRFEIRTNFTGTKTELHTFNLQDMEDEPARVVALLRKVMETPQLLRPDQTRAQVTEKAASNFADLANTLTRRRGHKGPDVAHFLERLLFCFFAQNIGLLPHGILKRLLEQHRLEPDKFTEKIGKLFAAMAKGDAFGVEEIRWFNGGLFDDGRTVPLAVGDLEPLVEAERLDWSSVEPAILGTLFERGLDPSQRRSLGAHYTDIESIERVVEPVVIRPLRRDFDAVKALARAEYENKTPTPAKIKMVSAAFRKFLAALRKVRILDPACGSGNFLYVALKLLKDLEKEAVLFGVERLGLKETPTIGPECVHGIETSEYAAEVARVTIWIGEIQWRVQNGYGLPDEPILKSGELVEHRDAILDRTHAEPERAEWPDADFIIGNPPFLGSKQLRKNLDDNYVDALFGAWEGHVPRESDLFAYWHEKAREMIEKKRTRRAGLLASQSIRGGANQKVLKKIKQTGDIFLAWSSEPWVLNGADVNISIVCQDNGSESSRMLDGHPVASINADLTGATPGLDLTAVRRLKENRNLAFMGDTKGGAFDVLPKIAAVLLKSGPNVNGKPNSDVVLPWTNTDHLIKRRTEGMYVIDFDSAPSEQQAAMYEAPFKMVRERVKSVRAENNREAYAEKWWLHVEPRPTMRAALGRLKRFLVTPTTAEHRIFMWLRAPTVPDHQLIAFARDDDFFFGVLQSHPHEVWALQKGTHLQTRPRYTPTSTFETFPFPWAPRTPEDKLTPEQNAHREAIASAAKELNTTRERWLNPPEWVSIEPGLAPNFPDRVLPKDVAAVGALRTRTMTALYKERPGWLEVLHRALDAAVASAYGWPPDLSDEDMLARLLALNLSRPAYEPKKREPEPAE